MSQLSDAQHTRGAKMSISRQASIRWIMLIYFASGACSLIDEVVWVRLLKLTLGNTVYASSIVVSVFMGGLALGALIMSRYCDRVRRRLRLYALLETLVTLSALALPWALRLADNIYIWFYRTFQPDQAALLIVQVVISAALLLVPTMLMGSTLPLLGRFVTSLEKQTGHLVGRLYALNTLGASAGCFLAGFVLIRALGIMGTLYAAAALNILVAFGGWFLSRFAEIPLDGQIEVAEAETAATEKPSGRFCFLVVAFFLSGLICLGYELLWMRSIVHLVGGFTYVFSSVLGVYLLGNVIGAGIGSKLANRLKNPGAGFAVSLSILGAYGVFYFPLLAFWSSKVVPFIDQTFAATYSRFPFTVYMLRPLGQSIFLFLGPAVIMGIGFPMALQAWADHMHKVGRSTGTAYGANTIGAVIGGIATGFVLIPLLGVQLSVSMFGLIGVWIAGIMLVLFTSGKKPLLRWALLAVAVILTATAVKTPANLHDKVVAANQLVKDYDLVYVKEGTTTTIGVHRDSQGNLHLYGSGQKLAGDSHFFRGDQKMLGHFGVMLNSNAKRVLSVGFGSGESTACLSMHKLDAVDCVEIAPEVVEMGLKFFKHINLGDRLDDEVNLIIMDAKNYVYLTDVKYDAIVNDSIHPRDFAENASLYGKEYFESSLEHLNDKGLFISWVPTHDVFPTSALNSIVGTMMEVFPHVTAWYMVPNPAAYYILVGSAQEQYFSPKHMEKELLKDGVLGSLSEIDINNSMDVLSCYLGDEKDLRKVIKSFSINSDYFPFVEFNIESPAGGRNLFAEFVAALRSDSVYDHIDWTGFTEDEKNKWLADYRKLRAASVHLLDAHNTPYFIDRLKYSMEGLSILPNNPALLYARAQAEARLLSAGTTLVLSGRSSEAIDLSKSVSEVYPKSAVPWVVTSVAWRNRGETQQALFCAQQAVSVAPENVEAHRILAGMLTGLEKFDQAVTEYERMLQFAEKDRTFNSFKKAQMLDTLASSQASANQFAEAVKTAQEALELASATGQEQLARRISENLALFKTGHTAQPLR